MVRLTLTAALAGLVSETGRRRHTPPTVAVAPGAWSDVVGELRAQFPRLAARVLDDSGSLLPGFVLILDDEVVADETTLHLRPGDRMVLIPALAGG